MSREILYYYEVSRIVKAPSHRKNTPSHRKNTPSHCQGSLISRKFIYIAKTFLHYENSRIVKVLLRSITFLVPVDDSRVIFQ